MAKRPQSAGHTACALKPFHSTQAIFGLLYRHVKDEEQGKAVSPASNTWETCVLALIQAMSLDLRAA